MSYNDVALAPGAADLLRTVAAAIKHHPDKYNQGNWCGTACCVAGHIALASGYIPVNPGQSDMVVLKNDPAPFEDRDRFYTSKVATKVLLGRDNVTIDGLFSGAPESDWEDDYACEWREALDDYAYDHGDETRLQREQADIAYRYLNMIADRGTLPAYTYSSY